MGSDNWDGVGFAWATTPGDTFACIIDPSWHSLAMAGNEIDPIRAKSAFAVIRQHPVLVLFAVSPALAVLAVIGRVAGAGWAIAVVLVLLLAGAGLIVVRR